VLEVGQGDPAYVVRFFVADERFARIGFEGEPHVVVVVLGFVRARRNAMHVDIVDVLADQPQRAQTGFFARFAQRGAAHVGVTVDVAAQLQPALEFAMV
jgi:hypothetical protein